MGGRTCQVGLVGRDLFFLIFKKISGAKLTLKTQTSWKKSDFFAKISKENILIYFQHLSDKTLRFWSKKWPVLHNFGKLKKKISQIWKNGLVGPVKHGFLHSSPDHYLKY